MLYKAGWIDADAKLRCRAALQQTARCQQTLHRNPCIKKKSKSEHPRPRSSAILIAQQTKREALSLQPSQESDILETQSDHGPGFLTV